MTARSTRSRSDGVRRPAWFDRRVLLMVVCFLNVSVMRLTVEMVIVFPASFARSMILGISVLLTISPLNPGALAVMVVFPVHAPLEVKPVAVANPFVADVQGAGEPLVQIFAT